MASELLFSLWQSHKLLRLAIRDYNHDISVLNAIPVFFVLLLPMCSGNPNDRGAVPYGSAQRSPFHTIPTRIPISCCVCVRPSKLYQFVRCAYAETILATKHHKSQQDCDIPFIGGSSSTLLGYASIAAPAMRIEFSVRRKSAKFKPGVR